MSLQINIRPDPSTQAWLVRQAQYAKIPVSTYARQLIQEVASEVQRGVDLELIAEAAAERAASKVIAALEEFVV